jgi:hypothetical protein
LKGPLERTKARMNLIRKFSPSIISKAMHPSSLVRLTHA